MKKEINLKKFTGQFWSLLKPSRKDIFWLIFWVTIAETINLIGPYILNLVIDLILEFDGENLKVIFYWIGAMFAVNQIASFFDYITGRKALKIVTETDYYLANDAQKKMVELGLSYHEKENTGNKIIKIQRGIDRIRELLLSLFWEVIPIFFQVVFTTVALFWVDYRFGLITIFYVPVFIYITLKVNKKVHPQRVKIYKKGEEASGMMTQSIVNINTVKSFVQERKEVRGFREINRLIQDSARKVFSTIMKFNLLRTLVINLGRITVLLVGIYLVSTNNVTLGNLVFVFTISEKALISLFRISRLYDNIMESSEPVARLHDLSLEKPDIKNPEMGIKPKTLVGKIEFKDVSYAYSDNRRKALKEVSLQVNPDSMTAFVGPSGGGKTTLARMIFRHYDPQEGQILLDGYDLREYDLYAFRNRISIVPQDVEVFSMSVKDNIAYSKPKATFEEIKKAAKIANADEFIKNLEEGYDTEVGERGVKLSGGQRQRIGIARAILADPRILIFDEATSNLDSYSEKLIQDAMEKIRKNRTVIIIAHRLSTIKKSDQIFVLENGRVVEEGTHKELAKEKCGLYKKLIDLQKLNQVE